VLCAPPEPEILSYQLTTYSYYMGLCFSFKPFCAFGWRRGSSVRAQMSLMMMLYREMEGEGRLLVSRTAAFQVSTLLCSCMRRFPYVVVVGDTV
jgi:hypothetical protein